MRATGRCQELSAAPSTWGSPMSDVGQQVHGDQQPMPRPAPGGCRWVRRCRVSTVLPRSRGHARYAAEHPAADLAFGVVRQQHHRARPHRADRHFARAAVPGVLEVLTHDNRPQMRSLDFMLQGHDGAHGLAVQAASQRRDPLQRAADRPGGGRDLRGGALRRRAGAGAVRGRRRTRPSCWPTWIGPRVPSRLKAGYSPPPKPRGDADSGVRGGGGAARCRVHQRRRAPQPDGDARHHRAARRRRPADGLRQDAGFAEQPLVRVARLRHLEGRGRRCATPTSAVRSAPACVRNTSCYLAVMAALRLKRSVRVVLTRQQMFTFGHRPETWQRVQLGADARRHACARSCTTPSPRPRASRTTWRSSSTGPASSTGATTSGSTTSSSSSTSYTPDRHARTRRGARRARARSGDGRAGLRSSAWTRWSCG